jgi:hypothetical protein
MLSQIYNYLLDILNITGTEYTYNDLLKHECHLQVLPVRISGPDGLDPAKGSMGLHCCRPLCSAVQADYANQIVLWLLGLHNACVKLM